MSKRYAALVAALAAVLYGAGALAAENEQNEVLNFDRTIKESVDNFRILRTNEKAQMNDYVTRVFELKNAPVMEVVPYVIQAVRAESGAARTLRYKDPATGQERNFIQVVCPPFQLPGIEQLIKTFDLPGVTSSPGDTRFFYRMQHRSAADVRAILQNSELSAEGSTAIDAATNTLYFRDSASDFGRGLAVVRFMDVPIPQVEFEVEIFELDRDDEDRLGLYWEAWKNSIGGAFKCYRNSVTSVSGFESLITVGASNLAQFLNYLVEQNAAKVVTRTRISVQNGQQAVISSLKRIPYLGYSDMTWSNGQLQTPVSTPSLGTQGLMLREEQALPNQPGGTNQTSSTDRGTITGEKSEGIYLAITPTIGCRSLSASIVVTVNSLVGFTKLDVPIITERRTVTTATLVPGQVFALGGMDKETVVAETRGIPLLRKLPIVGALFRYNTDVARKSVLIITIKPTVKNQLLYRALTLGWGAEPITADDVIRFEGDALAPNPTAGAAEAPAEGESQGGPALKWGPSLWRDKP